MQGRIKVGGCRGTVTPPGMLLPTTAGAILLKATSTVDIDVSKNAPQLTVNRALSITITIRGSDTITAFTTEIYTATILCRKTRTVFCWLIYRVWLNYRFGLTTVDGKTKLALPAKSFTLPTGVTIKDTTGGGSVALSSTYYIEADSTELL